MFNKVHSKLRLANINKDKADGKLAPESPTLASSFSWCYSGHKSFMGAFKHMLLALWMFTIAEQYKMHTKL